MALIHMLQPLSFALEEYDQIAEESTAFLVAELQTGKIITQHNIDNPVAIASLSKLMTYLLIKEKIRDDSTLNENSLFTIPPEAVDEREASAHYKAGEQVSVSNMLEALMIVSGNDAASALAIFHSGSVERFVDAMNVKAKELGLVTAHFINPSGLTVGEEYNRMSLFDYLTLSRYTVSRFPEIRTYSQQEYYTDTNRDFQRFNYALFIKDRINQADYIKTGFTDIAGYSAIIGGRFEYNVPEENYEFIAVLTGAQSADARVDLFTRLINGVHFESPLSRVKQYIHYGSMVIKQDPWYPSNLFKFRQNFLKLGAPDELQQ